MKALRLIVSHLLIVCFAVMLFVPRYTYAEESGSTGEGSASATIISGVSPEDGALITESSTLIRFSLGIPLADTAYGSGGQGIMILVDDQPIDDMRVNYMHGMVFTYYDNLQNGTHSLIIRVFDRDMKLLEEYKGSFTVRLSVWEYSILEAANIGPDSLQLSWTPAKESLGYRIYGNSILLGAVDGNTTSFDATNLKPSTTYILKVEAQRSDGTWTTDGPALTVTTLPQDRTSPVIESVSPTESEELTTAWPKITAKVYDKDSGINLDRSMVGVDNKIVPFSYNEALETLTAIPPRLPSGTHSLLIFITDNDGNQTTYTSSFTVKYEAGAPFLERMDMLRSALNAGDPADVRDVRRLKSELAQLHANDDLMLIDPIWNKIKPKLPASVDQAKLKKKLFQMILTFSALPYDQQVSRLEALFSDPEFVRTLNRIAAAGGETNLTMEDIQSFLFGDGKDLRGIEGNILYYLSQLSPAEMLALPGDNRKMTEVLMKAITAQLGQTSYYKVSSILKNLNITAHDVQATLLNFQRRLKHDGPAGRALAVAYIRSMAQESVKVGYDGSHIYSLKAAFIDIPPQALIWKKVSGSSDFRITPSGVVSLSDEANRATAVIQAALVNPYGGANKVIFEKEVSITLDKDKP